MAVWNENAKVILESRYLLKDKTGKVIETPDAMLERVAKHISGAEKEKDREKWYKEFMSILDTLEFLPNSPTLMNAGTEMGQLSGCFLVPVEDNLSAIMEAVKQTALIHKSGGGTGIVFSNIRPSGSIVNTTTGVASGPVSFMKIFDTTTGVVKQGGKRRGANMGILACSHPDILNFIKCKEDTTQFTNFNISVSITDNFMKAVKADNGYPLVNPYSKEKTYVKAADIFHVLCEQAWKTGEPGIIFIDTINKANLVPEFGRIMGTNPCGEVPLLFWESCNLGSINVSKMIKSGKVDWNRLNIVTEVAVRFLDDTIDVNKFPNVKIARKTRMARKIGLGVMGWADMLIDLGIRYDSDEALDLAKRVMSAINDTSHEVSKALGKEKGYCLDRLKRRNAATTVIAPTGTLSLLAGCSSSIEPIFAKEYTKTVMDGVKLDLSKHKDVSSDILVTAQEISIEKHIAMQAAFQTHTDGAVSKTINLPKTAKVATVAKAFLDAHAQGCKGITVYREGSREGPMVIVNDKNALSECDSGKCSI